MAHAGLLTFEHPTSPCWKQMNLSRRNQHYCSRNVGWIPPEQCGHAVAWKDTDLLALTGCDTQMLAGEPERNQWLCGPNLWTWLPPGWLGHCALSRSSLGTGEMGRPPPHCQGPAPAGSRGTLRMRA